MRKNCRSSRLAVKASQTWGRGRRGGGGSQGIRPGWGKGEGEGRGAVRKKGGLRKF